MKDKWYIVALVLGIVLCIAVATYSYLNPTELLPKSEDIAEDFYSA